METEVTKETIDAFLAGSNPMEHIIKIETTYSDTKVAVLYRDNDGTMQVQLDDFYPFVWTKTPVAQSLFNGNRQTIAKMMKLYNIGCKGLRIANSDGEVPSRMENGYKLMFYAKSPMSWSKFQEFFEYGGKPIFSRRKKNDLTKEERNYISVSPTEQYMMSTGKRLFKGYDDYDDLIRMVWDLETEGLDPQKDAISQIGIRTNKGFEKIITIEGNTREEKLENELNAIFEFFHIIRNFHPDILSGHNTENFDWNFIDVRLKVHGMVMSEVSKDIFFGKGVYKKKSDQVLKLGGEMEYYKPTVLWGINLTDSLFAVRRAQAIDSNMKKADLKYVTKYSKLNKPNRVYVPGKLINKTWEDLTPSYAFNDDNGEWFKITDEIIDKKFVNENGETVSVYERTDDKIINKQTNIEYRYETGRYIVQRYLLDDLYETDKVEARYNQSNYLVGKMLPVSYDKMCTMGTAAIWKLIMLAWSYENGLAIPELIDTHSFTGGLSRLLVVGYVDRIVKLDYNSLYPSIILSYGINSSIDIMGAMSALLEYILTQREYYKGLKGEYGSKAKKLKKQIEGGTLSYDEKLKAKEQSSEFSALAARYDKMQLPLKITANAFFGSYGSGTVFPHSDLICAEETTCTGRMCLRLMIGHFTKIGYKPIVGDSFTADTPIFIKYKESGLINIIPISEAIDEDKISTDVLKREYDYSVKPFYVLCKSGWVEPSYIYRHKTNKDIYEVEDGDVKIEVTEDHSLYSSEGYKITPKEINDNKGLLYYDGVITHEKINVTKNDYELGLSAFDVVHNNKRIPIEILNSTEDIQIKYSDYINDIIENYHVKGLNKTLLAGIQFLNNVKKLS